MKSEKPAERVDTLNGPLLYSASVEDIPHDSRARGRRVAGNPNGSQPGLVGFTAPTVYEWLRKTRAAGATRIDAEGKLSVTSDVRAMDKATPSQGLLPYRGKCLMGK